MTSQPANHGDGTECVISVEDLTSEDFEVYYVTNNLMISKYFNKDFTGYLCIGDAETPLDRAFEKMLRGLNVGMEYKLNVVIPNSILSTDKELTLNFTLKFYGIDNSSQFESADEQRIDRATYLKEKGVNLFNQGKFEDSVFLFSGSLKLLLLMDSLVDPDVKKLMLDLYSNLCLCHIKKKNFDYVIQLATDALDDNSAHLKILYHKGCSEIELRKFEEARNTFMEALTLDPKNTFVLKKLALLSAKEKESLHSMQGLKKMFGYYN